MMLRTTYRSKFLLCCVAAIVAACLLLAGCSSARQGGTSATESGTAALGSGGAPQTGPAPDPSLPAVQVSEVPGWQLSQGMVPGVQYQYARTSHEEPFTPTASVVVQNSSATSVGIYADAARDHILATQPGATVVVEQTLADQEPPVSEIVFQYDQDAQRMQVMQLYFRRASGEIVVVSFQCLAGQWPFLEPEFKQILSAIQVNP